MRLKLIKFFSEQKHFNLGKPVPAKKEIPEWYRLSESTFIDPNTQTEHAGLKKCVPFMDTMVSGYFLTIPVNIYVNEKKPENSDLNRLFNNNDSELSLSWDGPPAFKDIIMERPKETGHMMPRPAGHHPNHLVFSGKWSVKTPRGWSLLMTPPLNRYDLPFTSSSGIIDSDKFTSPGNIPFFIRQGFSGVIPAGTPFVQLIPIKRAEWQMVDNDIGLQDRQVKESFLAREKDKNYKKTMWQRKKYS